MPRIFDDIEALFLPALQDTPATVSRWENGHVKPSRLAVKQLDAFCARRTLRGKLIFSRKDTC